MEIGRWDDSPQRTVLRITPETVAPND